MSVTLQNTAMPPERILIHLLHDHYCAHVGKCSCSRVPMVEVVPDKVGKKSLRKYTKKIPATMRVPANGVKEGLHDCVAMLPDVIAAVRAGKLKVITQKRTGGQQDAAMSKPAPQQDEKGASKPKPKAAKKPAAKKTRTRKGGHKK